VLTSADVETCPGYGDDDIVVLYASGTHTPYEDLDGEGTGDVDHSATKANPTKVMKDVGSRLAPDGKFFFYSTNHGGQRRCHHGRGADTGEPCRTGRKKVEVGNY